MEGQPLAWAYPGKPRVPCFPIVLDKQRRTAGASIRGLPPGERYMSFLVNMLKTVTNKSPEIALKF